MWMPEREEPPTHPPIHPSTQGYLFKMLGCSELTYRAPISFKSLQISQELKYEITLGSLPNGEGNDTSLQYSCLEYPMDGGAWWAAVHGVARRWTRLSHFTFTFHFHALEKEMVTHSSVLAGRIPGMREPGGLPSMGSRRVGHD